MIDRRNLLVAKFTFCVFMVLNRSTIPVMQLKLCVLKSHTGLLWCAGGGFATMAAQSSQNT
jgi:hypothetical protein